MKFILTLVYFFSSLAFGGEIVTGNFIGPFHELKFLIGKNSQSPNTFIFVEGDGDNCFPFDSKKIEAMMLAMSLKDNWVTIETSKSRNCDKPQFGGLDYYHRVEEILAIVNKLRQDFPEISKNLYLVGHSAGPHLILSAMRKLENIKGVVLMGSGHSPLDSLIIKKQLIDGYRQGIDEVTLKENIKQRQALFTKILNNCDSPESIWGLRSNKFWCQIFEPTMDGDALRLPPSTKILIVHGYKDDVVPVEDAFEFYSLLSKVGKPVGLKIYPDMDHGFWPKINELLSLLSEWAAN